jgi:hypothetical protein
MLDGVVFGVQLRERLALWLRLDHRALEPVDELGEFDRQDDAAFVRDVFGRRGLQDQGRLGFRLA